MKYTKKQLEENKKKYKETKHAEKHDFLLSQEEVNNLNETFFGEDSKSTNKELQKVNEGNFGNFNEMNGYYRSYFASKALYKFKEEVGEDLSLSNEKVKEYINKNSMNCSFRLGLSYLKYTDKRAYELDAYASNVVLQNTLMPADMKKLETVFGDKAKTNSTINLEKQKVMAKTMFMASVGNYQLTSKDGKVSDYDGLLSETFVHGSRTIFVLPYGGNQEAVMESIYGKNPEKTSGLTTRKAATHYLSQQKVDKDGNVKSFAKERKVAGANLMRSLPNQFGMNFAGGGLGNEGPNKKPIEFNGTAGHMYVRKELGDENTCATLLVGLETSDSSVTDFTGHQHNMLAKPSHQSSFMADKLVVGKKIGGRKVDMSGLSPEKFIALMNEFDKVYTDLQNAKDTSAIAEFNDMICGKRLSTPELVEKLQKFGFSKNILEDTIILAREGFKARNSISEDKIYTPNETELGNWKKEFSKLQSDLKINTNSQDEKNRLFAIEKVDGNWKVSPLFDEKHKDATSSYKRMKAVSLNGGKIVAFKLGEKDAKEVTFKDGKITMKEAKSETTTVPQKPSSGKKFLNLITLGRAYKKEFVQYKEEVKKANEEREINTLIEAQVALRENDIKQETSALNRISLDSEKLKKDLGMDVIKDLPKSEMIKEKEVSIDKQIGTKK